ncbi:ExbD/TolR family protein [Marinimicrobium sp. ARAG 43.8]|uniref:ExbD/TolR family protein n=1 Tax=Marinimicrobium sp. ARAG 43.8 TaxID=3418719 RepID=UPI003CE902B2
MDIFTILVFFLLINASNDPDIPGQKMLTLPELNGGNDPGNHLQVMITEEDIVVQGRRVMSVRDTKRTVDGILNPLREELLYRQSLAAERSEDVLMVVADQAVAYDTIQKVVETSRSLAFRKVNFAARDAGEVTQGARP